jgi:peptidoglycan/xylan/chitin deacetylase (PgdA/CDA1 family)
MIALPEWDREFITRSNRCTRRRTLYRAARMLLLLLIPWALGVTAFLDASSGIHPYATILSFFCTVLFLRTAEVVVLGIKRRWRRWMVYRLLDEGNRRSHPGTAGGSECVFSAIGARRRAAHNTPARAVFEQGLRGIEGGAEMGVWPIILFVGLVGSGASFQVEPQQPKAGEGTRFAVSPAGAVSYGWDFGDGARAWTTGPTWRHIYAEPGEYAVTLAVTGEGGVASTTTARVRVTGKEFMITFDDGPDAESTPYILDQLRGIRKADGTPVKAGFFLVGADKSRTSAEDIWQSRYGTCPEPGVLSHPDLVRRIAREGHFIGIHTQHHADLSKIEPADVEREILDCYEAIRSTGVTPPKVFRPPHMHPPKSLPPGLADWKMVGGDLTRDYLPLTWEEPVAQTCREIIRGKTDAPAILSFHDFRALPGHRLDFAKIVNELIEKDRFVLVDFDVDVAVAASKQTAPENRALGDIADMLRIWRRRATEGPGGRPETER